MADTCLDVWQFAQERNAVRVPPSIMKNVVLLFLAPLPKNFGVGVPCVVRVIVGDGTSCWLELF